jgi:hypothetical protein
MLFRMELQGSVLKAEENIMGDATANPFFVALLCVARCLVPVLILFAISYLLRRFGVIAKPPKPTDDYQKSEDNGY